MAHYTITTYYLFPFILPPIGEKLHFWEGGIRVPAIFHWPGHIKPATTSDAVGSHLDFLPTLMSIVGGKVPDDRIIDGQDISSVLFNWYPERQPEPVVRKHLYKTTKQRKGSQGSQDSHDSPRLLAWYCQSTLMAVRYGCYKFHYVTQRTRTKEQYHAETGQCGEGGFPYEHFLGCGACGNKECNTHYDPPLMYNLCKDPSEAYPLNVSHPANQGAYEAFLLQLEEFLDNMELGPPLIDGYSSDVIPCCTPESFPDCTCNYKYEGPTPRPGTLYHELYNP